MCFVFRNGLIQQQRDNLVEKNTFHSGTTIAGAVFKVHSHFRYVRAL